MKHNYINDDIVLDFDPGPRIDSYIAMLEEYDREKRDEMYYVNAGEMIDWMHQDLIDGTINGAQYEKILEKYVYSIVDEL